MKKILSTKNIAVLYFALLLAGRSVAQYSPTPAFEGKVGKTVEATTESCPETQSDSSRRRAQHRLDPDR